MASLQSGTFALIFLSTCSSDDICDFVFHPFPIISKLKKIYDTPPSFLLPRAYTRPRSSFYDQPILSRGIQLPRNPKYI